MFAGRYANPPRKIPPPNNSFMAWLNDQEDDETESLMWGPPKAAMDFGLSSITAITISRQTWIQFFVLLTVGASLLALSMPTLPFVALAPQRFAILFSSGSMCIIAAIVTLKGPKEFFDHCRSRHRLPFSIAYFGSLVGTLYGALEKNSFVITLPFTILQIIALTYFLVSYIPGGTFLLNSCGGATLSMCLKR